MSDTTGLRVEVNPPGIEEEYLDCMSQAFGGWGDRQHFAWCFRRAVGGPTADLIVIRKNGAMIAGSAVTYRSVTLRTGRPVLTGIMTGSWTLPAARGQGCFTRIIEESAALTTAHGGALLLAYVVESNASARRLADAGFAGWPSFYCSSHEGTPVPETGREIHTLAGTPEEISTLRSALCQQQQSSTHFSYSPEEWRSQFLDRAGTIRILEVEGAGWGVVEESAESDRVLAVVGRTLEDRHAVLEALLRRALSRETGFFTYADGAPFERDATRLGLRSRPGFLYSRACSVQALRAGLGAEGSEPGAGEPLREAGGALEVGPWSIQNGDRM